MSRLLSSRNWAAASHLGTIPYWQRFTYVTLVLIKKLGHSQPRAPAPRDSAQLLACLDRVAVPGAFCESQR
eukprot:SAG25_NODE_6007_length_597_cov_0.947791_1_plen_70_part_10